MRRFFVLTALYLCAVVAIADRIDNDDLGVGKLLVMIRPDPNPKYALIICAQQHTTDQAIGAESRVPMRRACALC